MVSVGIGNISRLGQFFSHRSCAVSVVPGTVLVPSYGERQNKMVRDRTKHENHPMKSFSAPAYSKDLFKTTRKVRLKSKNIFLIF